MAALSVVYVPGGPGVIHFLDDPHRGEVQLIDSTIERIVSIAYENLGRDRGALRPGDYHNKILLNGRAVHFENGLEKILLFGKNYGTEKMFVENLDDNLIQIKELETSGNENVWTVDLSKKYKVLSEDEIEIEFYSREMGGVGSLGIYNPGDQIHIVREAGDPRRSIILMPVKKINEEDAPPAPPIGE